MKKHRIIVAGCGGMSHIWIKDAIARQNAEIVGLVDLNPEAAMAVKQHYNLNCGVFTDVADAIIKTQASLVFDVTIPSSHFQVCSAAMQQGADVFGEKPMAESMEDARALAALSQQTGRTYTVMQNRRYNGPMRAIQAFLQKGGVGRIGMVNADFFLAPHFGGFRDLMDSPLLVDMAIHTFDQARFLTGADPVSVYCHEFNPPGSWYAGAASAVSIFEMSDGSVFTYRGSWCAEGAPTSWDADWRITGEKGTVLWDGEGNPSAEIVAAPQSGKFHQEYERTELVPDWSGRTGHEGCFDEMFASIEEGRPAETDCRDNIKSMAMV